jgi:Flp pilus assembly protein TadG
MTPKIPNHRRGPRLLAGERGSVAVQIAILLIALIGFVALGTEIVSLMMTKRQMQSAADSAALAAGTAIVKGYPTSYADEAYALARAAGFVNGQESTSVQVHRPPSMGNYTASSDAVEVVITRSQNLALISLLRSGLFDLAVHAVALTTSAGEVCVLSLETTQTGVSTNGTTNANLVNCSLGINSTSSNALDLVGGAQISAQSITMAGSYSQTNNTTITAAEGIDTGAATLQDPYADLSPPSVGTCNQTNFRPKVNSPPASPGVYCGGITLTGGVSLKLNPGTYILDRGSLSVSGNSTLTGTGVTIILTSKNGNNIGGVSIAGGSIIDLTAPTSGTYEGIAFYQDARASTSGTNTFTGGTAQSIVGAIYFPRQEVQYGGGANTTSRCTQIVSRTIRLIGNAQLQLNCTGVGVDPIGTPSTRLVE